MADIHFSCEWCGQYLAAPDEYRGLGVNCPACGQTTPVPPAFGIRSVGKGLAGTEEDGPALTCPVCWLPFFVGDIMHIAVHDSLRGDPVLGEDAPQRFFATRFNDLGQALDGMGSPCSELACPHCRRKLPPGFLDAPHHIISLVGDQSAGKSYYLSVLAKVLPASLYRHFNVIMQDADPTGNSPLNDMKKVLFSAQTPAQAKLAKTQLEGAMYERLPRQGRMVALPKPFVYLLRAENGNADRCALVFYDNAGEHFQPGINLVEQPGAQHVASAEGILFLFDPFNSPEFRRLLKNVSDPQLEKEPLDQQDTILAEMRTRIQSIRNLPVERKIQTPLAVLAGKCDAWLHLMTEPPFANPVRDGALDLEALEANSRRVRDLLRSVCPAIVANAEALSENVCYFPVSSFGHTPVKQGPNASGQFDYVPDPARLAPYLVEIPPLWILSKLSPALVPVKRDSAGN